MVALCVTVLPSQYYLHKKTECLNMRQTVFQAVG